MVFYSYGSGCLHFSHGEEDVIWTIVAAECSAADKDQLNKTISSISKMCKNGASTRTDNVHGIRFTKHTLREPILKLKIQYIPIIVNECCATQCSESIPQSICKYSSNRNQQHGEKYH